MKVFSNLATSLDGKIADLRHPSKRLGGEYDWKMMQILRLKADAVIEGTTTLRASPYPIEIVGLQKKQHRQPLNVILSRSGALPRAPQFWSAPHVVRVVFTTQQNYAKAIKSCHDRALVFAAGQSDVDLKKVLLQLKKMDVQNVLVEGGGQVMASFLEAKLLHEINLTLTPWVLGGPQPSLVAGKGLKSWQALKLQKYKRVKDELYLNYKVMGARTL